MNATRPHSANNHQTEPIRPLAVARKRKVRRQGSIPLDFILGTVICVILVTIIVGGLWLYRNLTRPEDHAKKTVTPAKEPSAPKPASTQHPSTSIKGVDATLKQLAQDRRIQFLEAKAALEENGVRQWGGDGYVAMTTLGQQADALWLEERYSAAAKRFAAALVEADRLTTQKDGTLQQTLAAAQQAHVQGDTAKAAELFALVKLMDPDNQAAAMGLERTQNDTKVTELIEKGKALERKGDIAAGKAAFESALALDPEDQEARAGIKRITLVLAEARFKALMSEGLAAMDRGDLAAARSKLVRAGQMQPDNMAVKDAMDRLEQSARVGEIKRLQQSALTAETKENWEQALALYLMVLELDPNIQFAKQGRIHTQDRIRITKRMHFYIANPDVLTQDPQLQSAMALLEEARQLAPRGPVLTADLAQLEVIVTAAATPVKVILISDEQTRVAVYKIGRLGRFKQHVLDLRPGTYTVVGSRDGYQDVRKQIVVKPKQETIRIPITCTVKI